jgi:hypothetical protein
MCICLPLIVHSLFRLKCATPKEPGGRKRRAEGDARYLSGRRRQESRTSSTRARCVFLSALSFALSRSRSHDLLSVFGTHLPQTELNFCLLSDAIGFYTPRTRRSDPASTAA